LTTLADIFQLYGAEYIDKFGERILPSHKKVIQDVLVCRTKLMGGHTWYCENCREYHYNYHSCRNRNCPQCQNERCEEWLEKQIEKLLPVEYFMATFTLPEKLRSVARSHQKECYSILFQSSADSLKKLALDKRFCGGAIGMTGVLHTWSRQLTFHPHIHFMIPGIAISEDKQKITSSKDGFLMRVEPLSIIFRAKFRDAMKKAGLFELVPSEVWQQDWVVHIESVGNGENALKYLAPYVYRIAISNSNILRCANGYVSFRYKDSKSGQTKTMTVTAMEFMRRYLSHVLPKGFQKVRYFGFLHPKNKKLLNILRLLLHSKIQFNESKVSLPFVFKCPVCGRNMTLMDKTLRQRAPPLSALLSLQKDTN